MGVVTQDAHLFHETIRDNLLYARPEATEGELASALAGAQIATMVDSLPDGLDTVVGDRGYRLSGGEKQRLAIARLLLKAPEIVVLDEATAHLDSESEAAVQLALATALQGRTSLVIAHRLSTVREADQILVLDHGRIVERGRHEELLVAGGQYAELYRIQFEGQDPGGREPDPRRRPVTADRDPSPCGPSAGSSGAGPRRSTTVGRRDRHHRTRPRGQLEPGATDGLADFSHVEVVFCFDRVDEDTVCRGTRHPRGRADWPSVGDPGPAGQGPAQPDRGDRVPGRSGSDPLHRRVGLDAVDGTPVLDVKPYMAEFGPRGGVRQPAWSTELMAGYW